MKEDLVMATGPTCAATAARFSAFQLQNADVQFFPPIGCSGESGPEPGEPIGNPSVACPTPTPGALTAPFPAALDGEAVLLPLTVAACSAATVDGDVGSRGGSLITFSGFFS